MNLRIIVTLFLFLICLGTHLHGQVDKEFWFAAPNLAGNGNDKPLFIKGSTFSKAASIKLSMPNVPSFVPITQNVPANSTFSFELSDFLTTIENIGLDTITNRSLLLESTQNIMAFYEVSSSTNPELFSLKGKNGLGSNFVLTTQMRYDNWYGATEAHFLVIATQNNTTITVNPTVDLVGHPKTSGSYTISLNKGQVYVGASTSNAANAHFGGTQVSSDKPVAVVVSDDGTFINGCGDLNGDQMVPTNLAGTEFITLPGAFTNAGGKSDYVYVYPTQDNTTVTSNGNVVGTYDLGEHIELPSTNNTFVINTDKPSLVFQLSGFGCEAGSGIIPPITCTGSTTVAVSRVNTESFILNLLVKAGYEDDFVFNGSSTIITAADFSNVPNTNGAWKFAKKTLSTSQLAAGASALVKNIFPFHLGVIHGGSISGARYGYFSNFGSFEPEIDISIDKGIATLTSVVTGISYQWYRNGTLISGATNQSYLTSVEGDYKVEVLYDINCPAVFSETEVIEVVLDSDNDGIPDDNECGCPSGAFQNGGFESPKISGTSATGFSESAVSGWETTATDNFLEYWPNGFLGVPAAQGNQFVELNASQNAALFQKLCLREGMMVEWSVKHRGRSGTDVAVVKIGGSLATATTVQTMTDGNSSWGSYSGTYTVPAGQSETFFIFEAVSSSNGDPTYGNFIDDIKIVVLTRPPCQTDTDNDGITDNLDLDSDNDGILDKDECGIVVCPAGAIENGGFEAPVISGTSATGFLEQNVPGWETTATDNYLEFWPNGFLSVPAAEGKQFVELNASQNAALYQKLCLNPGTIVEWRVKHRGRSGTDVAVVKIGSSLANTTLEATMSDGNTSWGAHSKTYVVPEGQTDTYFIFEAVSSSNNDPSYGNFIDDVQVIIIASAQVACLDSDNDGVPNFQDTNSDNDNCPDADEGYNVKGSSGTDGNEYYGQGSPPNTDSDGKVIGASYITNQTYVITPSTPISITQQPADTSFYTVDSTFFEVGTSMSTDTALYQWQLSTDEGMTWSNIADNDFYKGSNKNKLVVKKATSSMDGYDYRVKIKQKGNACVELYSDTVNLATCTLNAIATKVTDQPCIPLPGNPSDGKAYVTASGGTPPYSYAWNTTPVRTTDTISMLEPGSYVVTVTDTNGCIWTNAGVAYDQDFDSYTPGRVSDMPPGSALPRLESDPDNWFSQVNGNSAFFIPPVYVDLPTGETALWFSDPPGTGIDKLFISDPITLKPNVKHLFTAKVRKSGNNPPVFTAFYSNDNGVTWNTIGSVNPSQNDKWETARYIFTPTVSNIKIRIGSTTSGSQGNDGGLDFIRLRELREGVYIDSATEICCRFPTFAGAISFETTPCFDKTISKLTSVSGATGEIGTLQYRWQKSTTGPTTGFTDISNSDLLEYIPETILQTTWYRRVAGVDCFEDWEDALTSNVIKVDPLGSLGNRVFRDMDFDGIQDIGEPGINGVDVELEWAGPDGNFNSTSDNVLKTTITGPESGQPNGKFYFCDLPNGNYRLTYYTPQGLLPTVINKGNQQKGGYLDADAGYTSSDVSKVFETFTLNVADMPTGENAYGDQGNNGTGFYTDAQFDESHDMGFSALQFEIHDPCVCNNDAQVNADNGTFMELVTVTGLNGAPLPPDMTWTVASVAGAYSASPFNEESIPGPQGAPIASGQPLGYCNIPGGCVVYNSANGNLITAPYGAYFIAFAHVDHEGYRMTVEGPLATNSPGNIFLDTENTCFYPLLTAISATTACDTDGPFYIQGIPTAITAASTPFFSGNASFIGGSPPYSYAAVAGLTDNNDGSAIFNPTAAGFGTHTVSYTFEGNPVPNSSSPGCWSAIEFDIQVFASLQLTANVTNITCGNTNNGSINLSINPSGEIDPEDYAFSWSGPNGFSASTEDLSNLPPGNYSVTVTHPFACDATAFFFVDDIDNNTPLVSINGNYQVIAPQCTGSVTAIYQIQILNCGPINWNNLNVNWGGASAVVNFTGNNYREYIVTFPSDGTYLFAASYFNGANTGFVDVVIQVTRDTDSQQPVVTCPAPFILNGSGANCSASTSLTIPTYTDNCGQNATISYSVINPDNSYAGPFASTNLNYTFSLGNSSIIWTVTDQAGNTASCTQAVAVVDNSNPSITCPAGSPFNRNNNANTCGYVADAAEFDPNASDNCGGVTLSHNYGPWSNPASLDGATFPVGNTTVIWTATDVAGNTSNCSITIVVADTQNPVFVNCPNSTYTVSADPDCSNGIIWPVPVASDNCPGVTVAQTAGPAPGTPLTPGTYVISYTATDIAGLTATCTFTINVVDDQNPILICPDDITVGTDNPNCSWTSTAGQLNPLFGVDNCPGYTLTYAISGATTVATTNGMVPPTAFNQGTSTITYTLTDAEGNTTTCSFEVVVFDNDAPSLNCPTIFAGLTPIPANTGQCSFTSTLGTFIDDNCDNNLNVFALWTNPDGFISTIAFPLAGLDYYLSAPVTLPVGINTLDVYARDDNNNEARCIIQINVLDTQSPVIQCPSGAPFQRSNNAGDCAYNSVGNEFDPVIATDNCPGYTLSHNYYAWGNPTSLQGATFPVGNTTVTWTITDESGNSATCPVNISVNDTELPVARCIPQLDAVLDGDGNTQISLTQIENGSTDNCGIASMGISRDGINFGPFLYVNCNDINLNVTLSVTDIYGNSNTCQTNISVYDLEIPDAQCHNRTVFLNAAGTTSITPADINASSSDNCGIASLTLSMTTFDCDDIGPNNVILTITDNRGNTNTCTATVTVSDNIRPTFTCPAPVILPSCLSTMPDITTLVTNASDNCTVSAITQNPILGQVVGTNHLSGFLATVTVSDQSNNSSSCSVPVIILDNTPPTFVNCPQNVTATVSTFNDECFAAIHFAIPVAYDDCNGSVNVAPTSLNQVLPGSIVAPGSYLASFIATDVPGNRSDTCSFTVLVLDTQDPRILCPSISIPFTTDPGTCTWNSFGSNMLAPADILENCPYEITYTITGATTGAGFEDPTGTIFHLGISTITYFITDGVNPVGSCSFNITVEDNQPPLFNCPNDITVAGCAGTVPSVITGLTGTDNCGGLVTFTQNPVAGTLFGPDPGDMIIVTVIGTDARGNSTSCAVELTIIDDEMPYFVNCPHTQFVFGNDFDQCAAAVSWDIPVAMDNCDQLMAPQDIVQTLGNPPGSVFPVGGPYTIRYTATDEQGNSANCQFTFIVIDTQEPEILVGKPQNFTISCELAPPPPLVLNPNDVEDNCTPNPTINYNQTSSQNPNQANCGHYNYALTRTWTVTDQAGNQQVWNQIITVEDKKAPTMTLPANVTIQCTGPYVAKSFTCNPGANQYAPTPAFAQYGVPVVSDNCAPSNFICVQFTETFTPGACGYTGRITRTWTATDPCGNITTGIQTITIVDTTPPSFVCQDITVNLDANGNANINVDQGIQGGTASTTDNCSTANQLTFGISKSSFNCSNLGANEVVITVTDACGNIGACKIKVTVRDLIPPVITCPANVNIQLGPGECRASTSARATATDNCSAVITYSKDMFAPFEIGQTAVTAIATDTYGNISTCTFIVNIIEYVPVGNTMTCNNSINLTLDKDCKAVILADMILEGDEYRCYEKYCVAITTLDGIPHPNSFDQSDAGQTFRVIITDCQGSGNFCWGTVKIEEKSLPKISCPIDLTIACTQDPDQLNSQGKLISGEAEITNCNPDAIIRFADNYTDFGNCSTPRASIQRVWTATDELFRTASCTQNITISGFDIAQVVWPKDRGIDNPISCQDADANPNITSPDFMGYPTINGEPVNITGNLCQVSVSASDEVYEQTCLGSYEIFRIWKIRNMCLPLSASNPVTYIQTIKVIDNEAPKVAICPDDMTISVGSNDCIAATTLPLPEKMEDNCNDIAFKAQLFGSGDIITTGTIATGNLQVRLENLALGSHVVRYEFQDACGNRTNCTFNLAVKDLVPPVPVTKQYIVLGIAATAPGHSGESKLFTHMVDNGSYDDCTQYVKVELRRPAGSPACDNAGNNGYNNNLTFNDNFPILHGDDNVNDTDGGDYVSFCCADLATGVDSDGDGIINIGVHEVIMRVWDDADINGIFGSAGDNYNESWAYVRLEDKTIPIITCPPAMTIQCDNPITLSTDLGSGAQFTTGVDFTLTGLPVSYSACSNPVVRFRDNAQLNQCGIGTITRDFFVGDAPVNQAPSCRQIIKVDPSTSNVAWVVTPPSSTKVSVGCEGPSDDQIAQNKPTWIQGPCDVIGYTTDIKQFDFEDGVCRKWIVQYDLMNWCTNEAKGPYFKEFVFSDTENPQLSDCEPLNFGVDANCQTIVTLTKSATDGGGCIDNGWLKWIVFVDLWGDGTYDYEFTSFLAPGNDVANANNGRIDLIQDNNGNGIRDIYVAPTTNGGTVSIRIPEAIAGSMSNHKVDWKVTDGCHNYAACNQDFMVADQKAPTPYCVSLSSALMADPDGTGPQRPMVELWAKDFNVGSFDNCTDSDDLLFTFDSWAPQVTDKVVAGKVININTPHYFDAAGGVMAYPTTNATILNRYNNGELQLWIPAQRSSAKVWTDAVLPAGENKAVVQVQMSVWDGKFNVDFCMVELTLNCSTCPTTGGSRIAGLITTEAGQGVNNVQLALDMELPEFPRPATTDITGLYAFNDVPDGQAEITAAKSGDYMNGVSTFDIVMIQRHMLGIESFVSPYKVIAADINNDTRINSIDLVQLRSVILGVKNAFDNASWRFPVADQFININQVFPYQKKIGILIDGDKADNHFRAVKIGDVTGDVKTDVQNAQAEARTSSVLNLNISEQAVNAGEIVEIPVTAENYKDIFGYQFTMNLTDATFEGIQAGKLQVSDANVGIIAEQTVTMSYAATQAENAVQDEVLFTISIKAAKAGNISQMMALSSEVTSAEAYMGTDIKVAPLKLNFTNAGEDQQIALLQNEPNPFREMTKVSFIMPQADQAVLKVFDVTGKVVATRSINAVKGMNTEVFTKEQLGASGVLYYQLETGNFSDMKKMIVIE